MSQPETVRALIDTVAARRGDATYFIAAESGRTLAFDSLQRSCRRMAAWLETQQVAAGATVALVMPNGLATLRFLLGAMYAGRVVCPVNLLSSAEQMRYVLDHSDARIVLVSPEWTERVRAVLADIGRPITLVEVAPDAARLPGESDMEAEVPLPPLEPRALGLLMYTSGTTGRPKGVMLSHANLTANAHIISRQHDLGPLDRVTGVLPLYHINAFAVTMLAPLAHGGSVVMPSKFSAGGFWPMVEHYRCTWLNVVPTIISYLLEGETPSPQALAGVRFCRSASAPLSPEHHRAFEAKFGIGIVETMGLTETVAPSFSNPQEPARRKIGSVGLPSGCEARVVDGEGRSLADGSIGEIVIRGPQVTHGYYKNPDATAAAFFPDGWFRTGDLGRRDADGFFFITGRLKELIIKGGENIAPREIDETVLKHPAVREAAAVGIPDKHYGQEIMLCVILREQASATEDELLAFCRDKLGRYKTPKLVRFVDELPRGPSGKVQRLKLAELAPVA